MHEEKHRPLKEWYAFELQDNLFFTLHELPLSLYSLGMNKIHCEGLICEYFGFFL